MTTLTEQCEIEIDELQRSMDRYYQSVELADKHNRTHSTGYGKKLIANFIKPVSESLKTYGNKKGAGRDANIRHIFRDNDCDLLAYLGLMQVMNSICEQIPLTRLSSYVGKTVEQELLFSQFKSTHTEYYTTVMKDFESRGTKSLEHMSKALRILANRRNVEWESWTQAKKASVGLRIIQAILEATDLIEIKKLKSGKHRAYHVCPTENVLTWLRNYHDFMSTFKPNLGPCVIPPDDWTSFNAGGFWTPRNRNRVKLVRGVRSRSAKAALNDADLSQVCQAVNAIQRTPWRVNKKVLEVMQYLWEAGESNILPKKQPTEITPFDQSIKKEDMDEETLEKFKKWKREAAKMYTEETKRSSKAFQVGRSIHMANRFKDYPSIWFVHTCDFRGRVYACSSGISPQGADFNKALLEFGEAKRITNEGIMWLKVHGANCFGVDKVSFEERIAWVHENEKFIVATGENPIDMYSFWAEADKPWQFLAFCLEYAQAKDNPDFESRIPVGMDGSCNGLQHFSAMLRDSVGGRATNLLPGDEPADIYKEVADKATEILREHNLPNKHLWMRFVEKHEGIPREIAKRPVMTLPYGVTKYSCKTFVYEALEKVDDEFYVAATEEDFVLLVECLWEAIDQVIVSARAVMDWLQHVATETTRTDNYLFWSNPVGFPVVMDNKRYKSRRISSAMLGGVTLRLYEATDTLDASRQSNGIAPNLIHSMDSAHMMLTVLEATKQGITHFAMIHDDFGVHASEIPKFRDIIRESFVNMYHLYSPLDDLYIISNTVNDTNLRKPPAYGDLNLSEVLKSEYFFA